MIKKFGLSILTLFGVGYFKYAPGTAASFITCIIYYILWIAEFSLHNHKIYLVCFLIIILIYSISIIDKLSQFFKKKDPKEIVIDEFVGQCIPLVAFLFRPENLSHLGGRTNNYILIYILLSFILFRFFDILKPYPINIVDKKMKNGVGVMLDDIIAGIYSTIVIYIIYALWF
tara:strand:- start:27 stop:545 length:519 start_codon:yes stop_codon:yes gene_type:complete